MQWASIGDVAENNTLKRSNPLNAGQVIYLGSKNLPNLVLK